MKFCISRGTALAESLISDLQAAFPAVRCPTSVLQSCGDEDRTRTGSLQVLGCCSWRGWLSLLAGTASAEDASSFAASVLFCANLISPQVALLPPLCSLEILCPESCCRTVGKQSAFHTLAPFPADVSLDILHNTAVSPPLPLHPARQKPQREVKSRVTFSAKPLLKIPGKLIIFSPCSAIATFFPPKLHAYLWQN